MTGDLARLAWSFKSGDFVYRKNVHYYQTTSVRIETEQPLPTNVDGEVVDQTPVLFALARDALKSSCPMTARPLTRRRRVNTRSRRRRGLGVGTPPPRESEEQCHGADVAST